MIRKVNGKLIDNTLWDDDIDKVIKEAESMTLNELDPVGLTIKDFVDLLMWSYEEGYATAVRLLTNAKHAVVTDELRQIMSAKVVAMQQKKNEDYNKEGEKND